MLKVLVLSILLSGANASAACSAYCTPGVSKACGGGCISDAKLCRKDWTTACNGVKPLSAKPFFANPKKVDAPPVASVNK